MDNLANYVLFSSKHKQNKIECLRYLGLSFIHIAQYMQQTNNSYALFYSSNLTKRTKITSNSANKIYPDFVQNYYTAKAIQANLTYAQALALKQQMYIQIVDKFLIDLCTNS